MSLKAEGPIESSRAVYPTTLTGRIKWVDRRSRICLVTPYAPPLPAIKVAVNYNQQKASCSITMMSYSAQATFSAPVSLDTFSTGLWPCPGDTAISQIFSIPHVQNRLMDKPQQQERQRLAPSIANQIALQKASDFPTHVVMSPQYPGSLSRPWKL